MQANRHHHAAACFPRLLLEGDERIPQVLEEAIGAREARGLGRLEAACIPTYHSELHVVDFQRVRNHKVGLEGSARGRGYFDVVRAVVVVSISVVFERQTELRKLLDKDLSVVGGLAARVPSHRGDPACGILDGLDAGPDLLALALLVNLLVVDPSVG